MKFIRSITETVPAKPNGKTIVYMHGHGGYAWQTKRHVKLLGFQGYRVIVMDFLNILHNKDPQDLLSLMDEVEAEFKQRELLRKDVLLLGISMGALIAYTMMRRHAVLNKLLIVTGGNIALLPSDRSLKKQWKMTRQQLSTYWEPVNMHTPVGKIRDKHIVMFLPARDRIINPKEVREEIARHQHLNRITVITTKGGHFRTIFTETVLRPNRSLELIRQLEKF